MDPEENIKEQIMLARALIRALDDVPDDQIPAIDEVDVGRLCELVIAQHEWRVAGGFDPYKRHSPV